MQLCYIRGIVTGMYLWHTFKTTNLLELGLTIVYNYMHVLGELHAWAYIKTCRIKY